MGWSPELTIGKLRPWPDAVHVVRESTGEMHRYVQELTCHPQIEYLDDHSDLYVTVCSSCLTGVDFDDCYYCPNCGARVVDE